MEKNHQEVEHCLRNRHDDCKNSAHTAEYAPTNKHTHRFDIKTRNRLDVLSARNFALSYAALHLLVFLSGIVFADTFVDEDSREKFEDALAAMKDIPFAKAFHYIVIIKAFSILCYDSMIVLYMLKPEGKLSKAEKEKFSKEERILTTRIEKAKKDNDEIEMRRIRLECDYLEEKTYSKMIKYNTVVEDYMVECFAFNFFASAIALLIRLLNYLVFAHYEIQCASFFAESILIGMLYVRVIAHLYWKYEIKEAGTLRNIVINIFLALYYTGNLFGTFNVSTLLESRYGDFIVGSGLAIIGYGLAYLISNLGACRSTMKFIAKIFLQSKI